MPAKHHIGGSGGRPASHRRRRTWLAATAIAVAAMAGGLTAGLTLAGRSTETAAAAKPQPVGGRICGEPSLHSPYDYDGTSGPYRSGTAGLPTYGTSASDFPADTAGQVLPTGSQRYSAYQLKPATVYYLLPGMHSGTFMANEYDAFVGGQNAGQSTVLSGGYSDEHWAIDSDSSDGDQAGVTIEYLTIEKYTPGTNAAAINQETNTNWVLRYNTIMLNAPGAGLMAGSGSVITDNCLTLNGQYGFQSVAVNSWGRDSVTGGPYDITIVHNEISYNDTCDYEGLLSNPAIGWHNFDPVPASYRNSHCGSVVPDGDQGGFKLWQTDGVTIKNNYIHNNWGPGAWVDTDNANTDFTGNVITANDGPAITEEISYNFSITGNYLADNDWIDGLGNASFPQPAIYVAGSGSFGTLGPVPRCPEPACAAQGSYPSGSVISGNALVNNGGGVFLFQDSSRYCSDGSDGGCTLAGSPFTVAACAAGLRLATVDTATYLGEASGHPSQDWWDGCQWETENVAVNHNVIDFNPAQIEDCNQSDWPACGAGGVSSDYGSPPDDEPGWVVPTQITFFRHNSFADNSYHGPSIFWAWNQGNQVTWTDWTGSIAGGDRCSAPSERQSGSCAGPFGQDTGSTYDPAPPTKNPPPPGG